MKLDQKKERILRVLAEDYELNPGTYISGISAMTIGIRIGTRPPMDVIGDLQALLLSGYINRERFKWLINGKSLSYLKTFRK